MNGYVKKVSHTLILGIIIFLVCVIVYLAYPKYQVEMVRMDDNTVIITKINTLTGKTETYNPYPHLGQIDLDKILGD